MNYKKATNITKQSRTLKIGNATKYLKNSTHINTTNACLGPAPIRVTDN